MRKGRTVIGQDVYSLADGRRVHSVKDLIVSEDHDTIVALLVDEGGLLGTSTVVPIEAVHRFGPDAVMVQDSSSVIPASADERVAATLDRKATLLGTAVVTSDGRRVGQIGDMYFDEETGEVLGYEVSGGALGDMMRGTSWLPLTAIEIDRAGRGIAAPEAADIVESQVGGVQGMLDSAGEQVASAGQGLGERLRVDGVRCQRRGGRSHRGHRRRIPRSGRTGPGRSRRRPAGHRGRHGPRRLRGGRQRPAGHARARPAGAR